MKAADPAAFTCYLDPSSIRWPGLEGKRGVECPVCETAESLSKLPQNTEDSLVQSSPGLCRAVRALVQTAGGSVRCVPVAELGPSQAGHGLLQVLPQVQNVLDRPLPLGLRV